MTISSLPTTSVATATLRERRKIVPQRRVQILRCGSCRPPKLVFRTSTLARSTSALSATCQTPSCHSLWISSHAKAEATAKPKLRPMQAHGTERLTLTCPSLGTCQDARGRQTEDAAKLFSTMRHSVHRGPSSPIGSRRLCGSACHYARRTATTKFGRTWSRHTCTVIARACSVSPPGVGRATSISSSTWKATNMIGWCDHPDAVQRMPDVAWMFGWKAQDERVKPDPKKLSQRCCWLPHSHGAQLPNV